MTINLSIGTDGEGCDRPEGIDLSDQLDSARDQINNLEAENEHLENNFRILEAKYNLLRALLEINEGNYLRENRQAVRENSARLAKEYLINALQADPELENEILDQASMRHGHYDEAAIIFYSAMLDSCIKYDDFFVISDMCYCYIRLGRFPEAIKYATHGIRNGYDNCYLPRALAFFEVGEIQSAFDDTELALQSIDELKLEYDFFGDIHSLRGKIYLLKADPQRAICEFETALNLGKNLYFPSEYDYVCGLGEAFHLSGDSNLAIHTLGKAINLEPNCEAAYRLRSMVLRSTGFIEEARNDESKVEEIQRKVEEIQRLYLENNRHSLK